MSKERKTVDRWDIMTKYGDDWDVECSEYSLQAALDTLKTYRENCTAPVRMEKHREPVYRTYGVRLRVPQAVLTKLASCSAGKESGSYRIELQTPEKKHKIKFKIDACTRPVGCVINTKNEEELLADMEDTMARTWTRLKTEFREYIVEVAEAADGVDTYSIEPINEDTPFEGWSILKAPKVKKVYKVGLEMPCELLTKINGYLNARSERTYQGEDNTITVTLRTPDRREIDIKCCGCNDESSWAEAVLFESGSEVSFTEPQESFEGEWLLESDNATYIVDVKHAHKDGGYKIVPFNNATPLDDGWAVLA